MFLIFIPLLLVLTPWTHGQTACDDKAKYPVSKVFNGHCFFEPPDHEYEVTINDQNHIVKIVLFNLPAARRLCNSHLNSNVLRYDMRRSKAILDFIWDEMRVKTHPPIDCYTEEVKAGKDTHEDILADPDDLDCSKPAGEKLCYFRKDDRDVVSYRISKGTVNVTREGNYFMPDTFVWPRKHWIGLICHQPPRPGSPTNTTNPALAATTSTAATPNIPPFILLAAISISKIFIM